MPKSAGKSHSAPVRSRRSAAKKPARPIKRKSNPLASEVKYLCLAALGILLVLFVYVDGAAGFIGLFIKQFTVGLLGFGAYVLPFIVIAASVFALFFKKRRGSSIVVGCAVIFFWCIIALLHVATMKETLSYTGVFEYFTAMYKEGALKNGGLLGGLLGNFLRGALGSPGAYIVLTAGILITLVLLTGRSFVSMTTLFAGGLRRYINDWREERQYEADEEDDEETYLQIPPPRTSERELKPLPPSRRKNVPDKPKPELLVIAEKDTREPNRVMLINEEINHRAPRKAKTEAVEPTPIVPLFQPAPPEPGPAAEVIDFNDITVKGLVGEGVSEPESFTDAAWDIEEADDEPPFETPTASVMPFPSKREAGREAQPLSVNTSPSYEDYQFPPIALLTKNQSVNNTGSRTQILENSRILEETLKSFRVEAKVIEVSVGPTVTRYDLAPGPGVKVSAIANLSNDLALSLAAQGIRIEAPIPGKAAVGIEIPNKDPQAVLLREIIEDDAFAKFPSRLAFAVGKDIAGSPVVTDVGRMPHLLIAGATGSGKSVCINTLITSLLYKSRPDEVKLLMIDPKVVELSVYNGIPHLLIPVVTDPKKASGALSWAVAEMDNRYNLFAEAGVRELKSYNESLMNEDEDTAILPQIVIIIDELADLMMVCKGEVEEAICRLAQKARAAGIHLIIATQRPSVDVITGLIKANIPSRLAFAVSSGIDSRTVLDTYGAEKLLGKGDMLFLPMGRNKPTRLQGCYVSEKEVENIVDFLKKQAVPEYTPEMIEKVTSVNRSDADDENLDEFFREAVEFLIEKGKASTSMLQRQFRIGYNRASRLMEDLETRGIVGPEDGVKPRKIMITREEFYHTYG